MIKNFDSVKEQLRELAGIINTFKSEAVQLRLIELVFEAAESGSDTSGGEVPPSAPARKRTSAPKDLAPSATSRGGAGGGAKQKSGGRMGGKSMLDRLLSEGFFKKPRTINGIVEHCSHNLAAKYKQSDFSGPLGRLTRDVKLKRVKNADKQYEYSEA